MMKKRIFTFAVLLFVLCALSVPVCAYNSNPRLTDEAGLLNDENKGMLADRLDEVSERHKMDIVIVTVKSIGDKTPAEYADDYFDYNGYGYGENHDGILLLVNMDGRDCYISTSGAGIDVMTDSRIESTLDLILPYLSSGEYLPALASFIDRCDRYITIEESNRSDSDLDIASVIVTILIISFALVPAAVILIASKQKSKEIEDTESGGTGNGDVKTKKSRNYHGYRTGYGTKSARGSSSRGGGGSSTHTSSSGRTHGGGGRSF